MEATQPSMAVSAEPENGIRCDVLERAWEEGRKPTRDECLEWLQQFTREQKLTLLAFLQALHAERDQGKEKAS